MSQRFKMKAARAEEICAHFRPSERAKALLSAKPEPQSYMDALFGAGALEDLIWYLAHGLPKREAVWWSCVCTRTVAGSEKGAALAAVEAAEAWVRKPGEETRRHAEAASHDAPDTHPARWCASAAFWSGGSIAPVGAPEAAAPEHLTAKAAASAILMAATREPEGLESRQRRFCVAGMDIARGGSGQTAPAGSL
jgi:hypothetical protein